MGLGWVHARDCIPTILIIDDDNAKRDDATVVDDDEEDPRQLLLVIGDLLDKMRQWNDGYLIGWST